MNFLPVKSAGGAVPIGPASLVAPRDGDLMMGFRGEDVTITGPGEGLPCTVMVAEPMGSHLLLTARHEGTVVRIVAPAQASIAAGQEVGLVFDAGQLVVDGSRHTRIPGVPPTMTDAVDAELDALSRDILKRNDRGGYTVPNELVYPFQWNWDSAFVAMGQAVDDTDRAWRELETLFLGQWADGMVPSIVFHRPHPGYYPDPDTWGTRHEPPTTGISQPPVAATAARVILERDGSPASRDRARALLPRLFASHRWWHEVRDPEGTGLVTVTHPWETGRDNAPDWDRPRRASRPASMWRPFARTRHTSMHRSVPPTTSTTAS